MRVAGSKLVVGCNPGRAVWSSSSPDVFAKIAVCLIVYMHRRAFEKGLSKAELFVLKHLKHLKHFHKTTPSNIQGWRSIVRGDGGHLASSDPGSF